MNKCLKCGKVNADWRKRCVYCHGMTVMGFKPCRNLSAPCTVGRETNYVLTCSLHKGHKGKHQTTFLDRTICWQWSRHQCCSFS